MPKQSDPNTKILEMTGQRSVTNPSLNPISQSTKERKQTTGVAGEHIFNKRKIMQAEMTNEVLSFDDDADS